MQIVPFEQIELFEFPTRPPLSERIAHRRSEMVETHEQHLREAAECWERWDMDGYFAHLQVIQSTYTLLALLSDDSREQVEDFKLLLMKEIVRVEKEMQRLDDKLAVTRGATMLADQAAALGDRHIRLQDQCEAVTYALTASSSKTSPR